MLSVVATTHHSRTNDLTTSKALQWAIKSRVGNYKRTRQGALTALLLYLYKYKVVHATTMCLPALMSMHCPYVLLLIHMCFP